MVWITSSFLCQVKSCETEGHVHGLMISNLCLCIYTRHVHQNRNQSFNNTLTGHIEHIYITQLYSTNINILQIHNTIMPELPQWQPNVIEIFRD